MRDWSETKRSSTVYNDEECPNRYSSTCRRQSCGLENGRTYPFRRYKSTKVLGLFTNQSREGDLRSPVSSAADDEYTVSQKNDTDVAHYTSTQINQF